MKRLNVSKKLGLKISIVENSLAHIWSKSNKVMKNNSNPIPKGKNKCLVIHWIHLVTMKP